MTDIFDLFGNEEGWRDKPYLCSEGYPTVGFGFKIGPKGAPIAQYQFRLPRTAGEVWMRCYLDDMVADIHKRHPSIKAALDAMAGKATGSLYSDPRCAVLLSMCYQMGLDGVAAFKNTLEFMAKGEYTKAAVNMLASKWAKQTPHRASRHAEQVRSGKWDSSYGTKP